MKQDEKKRKIYSKNSKRELPLSVALDNFLLDTANFILRLHDLKNFGRV